MIYSGKYKGILCFAVGALFFVSAEVYSIVASDQFRAAPGKENTDIEGFFSLGIENDIHVGTDRHYTSGVRLSLTSAEDKAYLGLEKIASLMPFIHEGDAIRSYHSLANYIFTPDNITRDTLDPLDRPYGGWLNLETGVIAFDTDHIDMWVLGLGVTGEPSLSEFGQTALHNIINSPIPRGWDNQIPFEVTFQLTYNRIWFSEAFELSDRVKLDFQPRFSVSAGSAFVYADVGFLARIGSRLEKDLGPVRNQPGFVGADYFTPSQDMDWYLFAGFQARAIAHNIFLDGGVFQDFTPTMQREPLVADMQVGAVLTFGNWRLSGFNTFRTKEFAGQREIDVFGGIQFTFLY